MERNAVAKRHSAYGTSLAAGFLTFLFATPVLAQVSEWSQRLYDALRCDDNNYNLLCDSGYRKDKRSAVQHLFDLQEANGNFEGNDGWVQGVCVAAILNLPRTPQAGARATGYSGLPEPWKQNVLKAVKFIVDNHYSTFNREGGSGMSAWALSYYLATGGPNNVGASRTVSAALTNIGSLIRSNQIQHFGGGYSWDVLSSDVWQLMGLSAGIAVGGTAFAGTNFLVADTFFEACQVESGDGGFCE